MKRILSIVELVAQRDTALEERMRLIRGVTTWTPQEDGDSTAAFLEAVAKEQPQIIGTPPEQLYQQDQEPDETVDRFYFGSRMPNLLREKHVVVVYGDFVTRLQPRDTVAIHAELKHLGLPKETVLLSADHHGKQVLVYRKINGTDYVDILLKMKWGAFEELGKANRAYALHGVELVDNGIDNWMYDGEHALRVDLGAAEIVYGRKEAGIRFPVSDELHHRLQPYTTLAQTVAFILDDRKALFADEKYIYAMEALREGLYKGGGFDRLKDVFDQQVEVHGELLATAQKIGRPYVQLYAAKMTLQGGAPS